MTTEPAARPEIITPDDLGLPTGVTPARLALGRAGSGMPTRHVLDFSMAHAEARDAVHASFDQSALEAAIRALGLETIAVESAAPDRATYLRRPDFGRRLSRNARTVLAARPKQPCDVLVIVGDGLSARAVDENAGAVITALLPLLQASHRSLGPIVLAREARVALGDEIGSIMGAGVVVMLIGERPGLSSADSLGAYLTLDPRIGRTDAERNCLSNIRAAGISPAEAAHSIAWLIGSALRLGATGVALKDESGATPRLLDVDAAASTPSLDALETRADIRQDPAPS